METKTENLKDYLFKTLTAKEFSELQKTLLISETKLSRLLSGTDAWDAKIFKKLATLFVGMNPYEIIKKFELLNIITITEMEEIIKEDESTQYIN